MGGVIWQTSTKRYGGNIACTSQPKDTAFTHQNVAHFSLKQDKSESKIRYRRRITQFFVGVSEVSQFCSPRLQCRSLHSCDTSLTFIFVTIFSKLPDPDLSRDSSVGTAVTAIDDINIDVELQAGATYRTCFSRSKVFTRRVHRPVSRVTLSK